jgi:hypothetical protein
MVSLVDIAPSTRTVPIQGEEIEVTGVTAKGVASLLDRFPELKLLISGKEVNFTVDRIQELAPDAIAAIIAAGCGYPGNKKAEAVSEKLAVGDQAELLGAIIELTMPQGIGPFVERITRLLSGISGGVSAGGGKEAAGS